MAGPDWYRWYPSKWRSGVIGLTPEQRAVYFDIINTVLDRGECPEDYDYLKLLCNCQSRRLKRIVNELVEMGKLTRADGKLGQKKAETERKESQNFSETQRKRVQNRWRKTNENSDITDTISGDTNTTTTTTTIEELRSSTPLPPHDLQAAVDAWNATAERCGLAKVQRLTEPRRRKLAARLRDAGGLTGWQAALDKLAAIPGLCGDNDRGWRADFDFLVRPSSFTKLMEGSYDHWKPKQSAQRASPHRNLDAAAANLRQRLAGGSAAPGSGGAEPLDRSGQMPGLAGPEGSNTGAESRGSPSGGPDRGKAGPGGPGDAGDPDPGLARALLPGGSQRGNGRDGAGPVVSGPGRSADVGAVGRDQRLAQGGQDGADAGGHPRAVRGADGPGPPAARPLAGHRGGA